MSRRTRALVVAVLVLAAPTSALAALNPDGSLQVSSSLQPLPAPVAGQPLFDRRADGHLQVGLTERGRDGGKASPNQEAGIVAGMGGTMMRVPINWAKAQPTSAPQYSWGLWDDMYTALVQRGIRPIFPVQASPTWAVDCATTGTECDQPPSSSAAQSAYAQFVGAVAQRYPLAAAIEIWNEPNNQFGAVLGPDPVAYSQLLAASYNAIKAARPAMRVLGGALGNYGAGGPSQLTTSQNMRLDDFLAAMEDNGAAAHMDGLSFHPYPASTAADPDNSFWRAFSYLGTVLDAKGDSARRLVPDEVGITSSSITEESSQSTTLQARYHDLDVPALSSVPKAGQVDAVIFHTDVNNIAGDKYGWVEPLSLNIGYRPHAVWCAFGEMLAGLSSCPATISP